MEADFVSETVFCLAATQVITQNNFNAGIL
jgi:hypothetical protein